MLSLPLPYQSSSSGTLNHPSPCTVYYPCHPRRHAYSPPPQPSLSSSTLSHSSSCTVSYSRRTRRHAFSPPPQPKLVQRYTPGDPVNQGVWSVLTPKRSQALIARESNVAVHEAKVVRREAEILAGGPGSWRICWTPIRTCSHILSSLCSTGHVRASSRPNCYQGGRPG